MNALKFFRLIFTILAIIGISFVFPVVAAIACGEYHVLPAFLVPMALNLALGAWAVLKDKNYSFKFAAKDVFIFVALTWIAICVSGAIPLVLSGAIKNPVDAFFESVSGFTTTGATILGEVENLPRSVNLWRCEMHWLGGMGIIALTVALLPLLGAGGFNLIKAESTGPDKGKITPKMANTAEVLWFLYLALTIIHAVALKICGMDIIDAVSYAFSTLGTGGFATRNESVASYNSPSIEIVCGVFMFLSGVNFSLYFYLLTRKFDEIKKNSELKGYVAIFFGTTALIALFLIPYYGTFWTSFRYSFFQVGAIMTTTGYATADYLLWPSAAQFLLFLLFFVGGSAGSTAGGFKVIRWIILAKQAKNEMLRMLHPQGIFSVRINGKAGRKDLIFSVAAFTFVYCALVIATTFFSAISGLDVLTSFTASLSIVGNVGPAFGSLGPTANYGMLHPALKLWYCFAMIAGRLEIYNLIIFFLPEYWRD